MIGLKNKNFKLFFGLFCAALIAWTFWPRHLFNDPWSFVLEDKNGGLLGARIAADGQWRFPPGRALSQKFVRALTLYEDKRFWLHPGIDPLAGLRAFYSNIHNRKIVSGASTIPMQVVRLSRYGKARTIQEKCIEVALAIRLSLTARKKTVLSLYASHAPFGGNVVGLEAASWRYFGRSPDKLSWAEAATLAVLPNNPSLIHPGRNRIFLLYKRNTLLKKLYAHGAMDSLGLAASVAEPLVGQPLRLPDYAPHLLERAYAASRRSKAADYRIKSTIDCALQERVIDIVKRRHAALAAGGIHNMAALVLSVNSGEARAYVGNAGLEDTARGRYGNDVDVITAPRSTGSVLKPLLYAGMLDAGALLPTTLIPDIPTSIGGFSPQNFCRSYEGAVPARTALARSLNIPAVRMVQRFGVGRFYDLLVKLGMTTINRPADDYGISVILGGVEGRLWDLCGIYASIARKVNEYHGHPLDKGPPCFSPPSYVSDPSAGNKRGFLPDDPLSASACWCALCAMVEVVRPGEEATWREFSSTRRIAWKTGTSFGFRDGWAIGCTPEHIVGVWVGNASGEGRPELIGIESAAPVLFDIFNILPRGGWFLKPEAELRSVRVCKQSGFIAGPFCPEASTINAPEAGLRSAPCPYHRMIHLDKSGSWRVSDDCEPVAEMLHKPWFVLPPTMEYYYRQHHADYAPLPPLRTGCAKDLEHATMGLLYPHSGDAALYLPRGTDGKRGNSVFEATLKNPAGVIHWHIDDEYIGTTTGIHQLSVSPAPGKHVLVLVNDQGERLERTFTVLDKPN
jgi:penicillin-binding protein 1C